MALSLLSPTDPIDWVMPIAVHALQKASDVY